MPVSLTSQIAAVNTVAKLRPADVCRAVPSFRPASAEMLITQLAAAVQTLEAIKSDERIIRFLEKHT